jgi:hypothetical protein
MTLSYTARVDDARRRAYASAVNSLAVAAAVAAATFRDLLRRPALLLAALATAALLVVLPQVCARAVEDADALALQAGCSTICVFLVLVAGFAGLRAGAAEGDLSAASEWRAAPLRPAAYVAGRFFGVVAVAAAMCLLLSPFLAVPQHAALREDPPTALAALLTAGGLLTAAAEFAAVGLLLAAITTPQLAAVSFVAVIVATRTVLPPLAARGDAAAQWTAVFPDAARLDWSRELAFHRPLDGKSAALAFLAAGAHVAACLCVATWALRRREP